MARKIETIQPIILIQEILIRWYKDERGSAFAQQRRQLPRRLRLPEEMPSADTVYLYQSAQPYVKNGHLNSNSSAKEFQKWPIHTPQSIRIEKTDSGILVYLHPRRTGQARKSIELSLGQWLEFTWNECIPYESTWGYEERILNIALIDNKKYDVGLFVDSEPNKTFKELVKLY